MEPFGRYGGDRDRCLGKRIEGGDEIDAVSVRDLLVALIQINERGGNRDNGFNRCCPHCEVCPGWGGLACQFVTNREQDPRGGRRTRPRTAEGRFLPSNCTSVNWLKCARTGARRS